MSTYETVTYDIVMEIDTPVSSGTVSLYMEDDSRGFLNHELTTAGFLKSINP